MSAKLISIIGPPGVGKTTLAELLATAMSAELIREDYAGNPFLAQSYGDVQKARLPAQIYFLTSRVSQLSILQWPADGVRVSDYGFCQDRIFAAVRLSGEELAMYERLSGKLARMVKQPDLLIHLDATEQVLMDRIARRGREFERSMTIAFMADMRKQYNSVAKASACPVIRVDCGQVDLRADAIVMAELIDSVKAGLTPGR